MKSRNVEKSKRRHNGNDPGRHVLDNALLWIGDGSSLQGHLVLDGATIIDVVPGRYSGGLPAEDLGGAPLSPGMIDLMVLGGFDKSILRDDPLDIARDYVRFGVTSCQFCKGTLPWESTVRVGNNVRGAMAYDRPDAARVLGIYLEGPFQQPDLTGASMAQYALPPTPENIDRILEAIGPAVTMVNVAPGIDGDVAAVRRLREAGKIVSMAHSNGPADRVLGCIDAGTSVLGHVWDNNAGRIGDSGVQQPTLEHVALTDDRVRAIHLICDGTHVHPIMIRLILRCRGVEAICLVTDAVVRAGCPDGPYEWDDGRKFVKQGGVGRTDQGWLCGSALLLPDHLRNFVRFSGLPPAEAIQTVTRNPAASLGLENEIGRLTPGAAADLLTWDDRLRVQRIWRAGQEIRDISSYAEIEL
ncbi:MAG: amidohydrolase family protein [Phycisphaerae bacterium]|nr:amidohydrolase family protein [Phycisphaerae bacterium]